MCVLFAWLAHLLMLWREMEKAYLELSSARQETAGMEAGWGTDVIRVKTRQRRRHYSFVRD